MELSVKKLRLFGIEWGNHHRPYIDHIIIHVAKWTPINIAIQQVGDLKHLGIIWGMDLLNQSQFTNAQQLLVKWCKHARLSRLSPMSKKIALEAAIYQKIIFYARLATWSQDQLTLLDRTVASFIRKTHKTAFNMPLDLLYLPKNLGGLGYKKLSHEIRKAQFALLWRLLSSTGHSKLSALSCISRGFRAAGQSTSPMTKQKMESSLLDRWWIHGITDYLSLMDLHLYSNGPALTEADQWIGQGLSLEQRSTLARLGLLTKGEALMDNDHANPLIQQIPLTACQTGPITLRPGQVWKCGDVTWEILAINRVHLQVIYWKPNPRNPQQLYIDEDNFCLGAGSHNMLDKEHVISLDNCELLTLDIEHHRRNGCTYSNILHTNPRRFTWPLNPLLRQPSSLMELISPLPDRVRDIYTDGSWATSGSSADRLLHNGSITATGAVILEDITEWGPIVYHGIQILGNLERPKSAYTYELLSIMLAAAITPYTDMTGCIRSDCVSAISTVTKCWKHRGLYRSYPLIGAIINTLNSKHITHVKAHPEKKKIDKEWTDQDCGIYVADQTASGKHCETTKSTIHSAALMDLMAADIPFMYLDGNGAHVIEDLNERYHRFEASRYLSKRDQYRQLDPINPRPAKWAGMNLTYMANITDSKKLKLSEAGSAVKALFDWHYTGSNRIKGSPNANACCNLCGKFEDRKHILLLCKHPEQSRLRQDLFMEARDDISLLPTGPVTTTAWELFTILESPLGHQLMTGQLEPELRAIISNNPVLNLPLPEYSWKLIHKILKKVGMAALNILRNHILLTARLLAGTTPSGLVRTSAGIQKSITSLYAPVTLSQPTLPSKPPALDPATEVSYNTHVDSVPNPIMTMINTNRLVPVNENYNEDDDLTVHPKRHSFFTIYDGTEMIPIRGKGPWRPHQPHMTSLARQNKRFMRTILGKRKYTT